MPIEHVLAQTTEKSYFQGTQRCRPPTETWQAYQPKLKDMGITRIANVTGLDRIGFPVYVAIRPNARALATSQGKGSTAMSAKVSAMMESIETWHCERIEGSVEIGSYNELAKRDVVIDVDGLSIRNDAVFHKNAPIAWFQGYDLISEKQTWLPYEAVSTNFVYQQGQQSIFLATSNGLASGNCLIEAINHAIYELIERDALSLWEFVPDSVKKSHQIDLSSIQDKALQDLVAKLKQKGVEIGVWEITSDIGIPVYTCTIVEDPKSINWRPIPMFSGHGCHLNATVAIARGIHEAIQSRLAAISGSRDDLFPTDYVRSNNKDDHLVAVKKIQQPEPTLNISSDTPSESDTLENDFLILKDALQAKGLNSIVVTDLSKKEIGIPVVKVIIPGLEPFSTGLYQPGRRAIEFKKKVAK